MNIFRKILYRLKSEINSIFIINGTMQQFFAGIGLYFLILYLRIKYRIWFLFFKNRNKNKRFFKMKINGSYMILDGTDRGISRELLYIGRREHYSTEFIKTFLKPGDICVDIGSNIGYYALLESQLIGENGKIFAIEPSRQNIKLLKKNIEINNYNNIVFFKKAVGSKNHSGFLGLSESANQHSFVNKNLGPSIPVEEVQIVSLDAFLADKPYPQFIRMDVEGYEGEIIKGMKSILKEKKPLKIFIEFHCPLLDDKGKELLSVLNDAGFIIKAVFKERLGFVMKESGSIISLYDFLFRKRFGLFNNSLVNYDIPIDEFIKHLPNELKENVFELFFERT